MSSSPLTATAKHVNAHRLLATVFSSMMLGMTISCSISAWQWYREGYDVAWQQLQARQQATQAVLQSHAPDWLSWASLKALALPYRPSLPSIHWGHWQGWFTKEEILWWHQAAVQLSRGWNLWLGNAEAMLARMVVLILAAPLLVLTLITGLLDGAMMRRVKRAQWSRISTQRFHRSLRCLPIWVNATVASWLVLPCSPGIFFAINSVLLMGIVSPAIMRYRP